MGRWAECLSQTRNFAKARFSEIWRRDRTIIIEHFGNADAVAAAAGAVLKPQGGNCAVLPKIFISF